MGRKPRLDEILVARGLFPDIHAAQGAILAGEVVVGEHRETSAGKRLDADVPIRVKGRSRFVSRGGEKLQRAFESFDFSAEGASCADLGCSSGGFTDCLLAHGAAHVAAIDVGYGQFDWRLRQDPRVTLFERTNLHGIDSTAVGAPFDLAVADLSFISLKTVAHDIASLLNGHGQLVTLIKPQFEAARDDVEEGGVVRDSSVHAHCIEDCIEAFADYGLMAQELDVSPIKGPAGNIEFLVRFAKGDNLDVRVSAEIIQEVVARAHGRL